MSDPKKDEIAKLAWERYMDWSSEWSDKPPSEAFQAIVKQALTDYEALRDELGRSEEVSTSTPLPCPFCGEPPELMPRDPDSTDPLANSWGGVRCINESCPAQPKVLEREPLDDRGRDAYQQIAIGLWNTRALRDQ